MTRSGETANPITVVVNGRPRDVPDQETVAGLVASSGLGDRAIAIEINGQLVPGSQFAETRLRPADQIEIVSLAGGG